jgi:hypothetical protein
VIPVAAAAPAPPPPVTAAPPPAPPPPPVHPQRALAIPVTGAAGAVPLTGVALLGAGALLVAGSLRRPAPRHRPFDDELPAHW